MINIPGFKGKEFPEGDNNFALESYEDYLIKVRSVPGFKEVPRRDSYGGNPIYSFVLGDIDNKPIIYIDGQIHRSHEWRTSYFIMHFMECLSNPHKNHPAMAKEINHLKSKYSFYISPVICPDSFIKSATGSHQSGNDNNVDVALNFDYNFDRITSHLKGEHPFSEPETKNVRDVILNHKPVAYVNCHAWGGHTGFMVRKTASKTYDLMYQRIFNSIRISTKLRSGTDAKIDHEMMQPTAYNWAGTQMSSRGKPIISNVLEPGDQESALSQSKIGVDSLLVHCLYVDNLLTNNTLNMY